MKLALRITNVVLMLACLWDHGQARAQFPLVPAYRPEWKAALDGASPSLVEQDANAAEIEPVQWILDDGAAEPWVDIDSFLASPAPVEPPRAPLVIDWLPDSLIYRSYLAGAKESRLAGLVSRPIEDNYLWEGTLGGRIGLLRLGTPEAVFARGVQLDVEASAQVRLDINEDVDVRSVDFRVGLPLTFGFGRTQWKLAYYHLSSHLGDEFLLKNLMFPRVDYSRDAIVLGWSWHPFDPLRLYAEVGWAFYMAESEPWEIQFGVEWAPMRPTGLLGAPFAAINAHLREEVDYGGSLNTQLGWAWRGAKAARLLRVGFEYYHGKSRQFSFLQEHEEQFSLGVWYDF